MNIDWLTHFEVTWPSVLLGMITGLTYGIIAVGLVLVYRTSRIINFAQGRSVRSEPPSPASWSSSGT